MSPEVVPPNPAIEPMDDPKEGAGLPVLVPPNPAIEPVDDPRGAPLDGVPPNPPTDVVSGVNEPISLPVDEDELYIPFDPAPI